MQEERRTRTAFWALWAAIGLVKLVVATRLPLFVDEAFYWQESRHLAWAYSDLPALTAWLIRLGTEVAGENLLGVRLLFLVLGAALPWLVVLLARPFGGVHAWQAGMLASVFPLSASLGMLALPDVPMNVAAVACLIGGMQALRGARGQAALWLAVGLAMGAMSHYRFIGVIATGLVALLCLPEGRRALRDPRIWAALAAGALAWLPLALWNVQHGDVGWRFQLVDRHPWALHADGFRFVAIQVVFATPLIFIAMLSAAGRFSPAHAVPTRWFALCGGLTLLGFFALGFVADSERVSFHWPLPAYLALLPLVPGILSDWSRTWRWLALGLLTAGVLIALGAVLLVASGDGRARLSESAFYPENFAGWHELHEAVQERLADMPVGTRLLVDHFKLGAELGFASGRADIEVLDHPLNGHHGRAGQLEVWNLLYDGSGEDHWRLLVLAPSDLKLHARLARYQLLCEVLGVLPPPTIVEVDHGARQFLLFALPPGRIQGDCAGPAIVHVDTPRPNERLGREFTLRGWAIRDGASVRRIEVWIHGRHVADAVPDATSPWVAEFFAGLSKDPRFPNVQFETEVRMPPESAGWQQLELRLHATDGNVEHWLGPRVRLPDEG